MFPIVGDLPSQCIRLENNLQRVCTWFVAADLKSLMSIMTLSVRTTVASILLPVNSRM